MVFAVIADVDAVVVIVVVGIVGIVGVVGTTVVAVDVVDVAVDVEKITCTEWLTSYEISVSKLLLDFSEESQDATFALDFNIVCFEIKNHSRKVIVGHQQTFQL